MDGKLDSLLETVKQLNPAALFTPAKSVTPSKPMGLSSHIPRASTSKGKKTGKAMAPKKLTDREKEHKRIKSSLRVALFKSSLERVALTKGIIVRNKEIQLHGLKVDKDEIEDGELEGACAPVIKSQVSYRMVHEAQEQMKNYPSRSPSPERSKHSETKAPVSMSPHDMHSHEHALYMKGQASAHACRAQAILRKNCGK